MLGRLLDLLGRPEFLTGLALGVMALVFGLGLHLTLRRRSLPPTPVAGLLFSLATLVGIVLSRPRAPSLWLGVGLLALAGAIYLRGPAVAGVLLGLPGAWLLGFPASSETTWWIRWFVLATVSMGSPLVADFDRRYRSAAWGAPLLALSVAGILFTVPDTELPLVAAGAALPIALLGWPVRAASLGGPGAYASVGLLLWIVGWAGQSRGGSVIGGAACLGFLVAEPLGRWLFSNRTVVDQAPRRMRGALVVGGAHLVIVALASRVAGLRQAAWEAILIAGPLMTLAVIVAGAISGRSSTGAGRHDLGRGG